MTAHGGCFKADPRERIHAWPRLMDLHQAAQYLSVSYWSIRDYVAAGKIPTVQLPPLTPREGARAGRSLRRIVVDRVDLDAFVDSLKRDGSVRGKTAADAAA